MQDLVFTFPIAGVSLNLMVLLALGFGVGILSGLFGVGGGFLLTPALFFLGVPPVVAVGTQSVQVLAASVSGFWSHLSAQWDLKMGLYLTLGGLLGSSLGVQLLALLRVLGQADDFIRLTYVLFLGFIGTIMLRERWAVQQACVGEIVPSAARCTSPSARFTPADPLSQIKALHEPSGTGCGGICGRDFDGGDGRGRRLYYGARDDLSARDAYAHCDRDLAVSDYFCDDIADHSADFL